MDKFLFEKIKMKKTISEIISNIQQDINNSSSNGNDNISEDITRKYMIFKKWLDENGVIYPKVNFPKTSEIFNPSVITRYDLSAICSLSP